MRGENSGILVRMFAGKQVDSDEDRNENKYNTEEQKLSELTV